MQQLPSRLYHSQIIYLSSSYSSRHRMAGRYIAFTLALVALTSCQVRAQAGGKYFDVEHAINSFELALADENAPSLERYVEGFQELRKFLTNTGALFRLVDSDLEKKVKTLEHMMKNPSKNAGEANAYRSIRAALEFEVERNLVRDHRGPAVCRIVSRLQWALEYLAGLLRELSTMDYKQDVSYAARDTYDNTLGKHHSWAVRLIVNLALRTLSSKRSLVKSVIGKHEGTSEQEIDAKIAKLAQVMDKLYHSVEKVYADNGLTDL